MLWVSVSFTCKLSSEANAEKFIDVRENGKDARETSVFIWSSIVLPVIRNGKLSKLKSGRDYCQT